MKQTIRRIVPASILDVVYTARVRIRAWREFNADRSRYVKNAAAEDRIMIRRMSSRAIETQATKDYHRVEKALALGAPKRPFGATVANRIDEILPYLKEGESLTGHVQSARRALSAWNDDGYVDDEVSPRVGSSGLSFSADDVESFFEARHSVRHFDSQREVSRELLLKAAQLAGRSPSVCNRQAWKVRYATTDPSKAQLLAAQNGNRGFGDVPVVALITADTRLFAGPSERNQAWIDGGLFAMSLVWALHGLGVASCMLNLSISNSESNKIREALDVPNHEVLIMEIAIGYAAADARVARSPRREVAEIVHFID